jgi:hypothetical protein
VGVAKYTDDQIWRVVERKRRGETEQPDPEDLKTPEYRVLTAPRQAPASNLFRIREGTVPLEHSRWLERVVLADRLREVRSLIGFTRIESPGEEEGEAEKERRGPISRGAPRWAPSSETRGEGLFLQFREEEVQKWVDGKAVRDREFYSSHKQWKLMRRIRMPEAGYPGLRFVLLHSFAHALIRQFALECGYTGASLRERIYSKGPEEENGPMAGVLLYTAAPDSEGTLGGLVALGEAAALARHIDCALDAARLCRRTRCAPSAIRRRTG